MPERRLKLEKSGSAVSRLRGGDKNPWMGISHICFFDEDKKE